MKKSEIYCLSQIAVISSPSISPENKLEILKELLERENLELYLEGENK
jgi:hypothetical protein